MQFAFRNRCYCWLAIMRFGVSCSQGCFWPFAFVARCVPLAAFFFRWIAVPFFLLSFLFSILFSTVLAVTARVGRWGISWTRLTFSPFFVSNLLFVNRAVVMLQVLLIIFVIFELAWIVFLSNDSNCRCGMERLMWGTSGQLLFWWSCGIKRFSLNSWRLFSFKSHVLF